MPSQNSRPMIAWRNTLSLKAPSACTRKKGRNRFSRSRAYWECAMPVRASVPRAARDRAPADVAAVEGAGPGNGTRGGVGAALRVRDVLAQRARAQHAATGRHDPPVDERRA